MVNVARSFEDLAHQIAALEWLQEHIPPEVLAQFAELYRADPPAKADPSPSPGALPGQMVLRVPYEAQNDNQSGTGWRECFSSSCAMVARFYGKVSSDDAYNRIRARYGDTTDAGAQLRALSSLGLHVQFRQNGSAETLERLIRAGKPVPVGWLHKGPVSAPAGGGHWSVVIGFTPQSFIHHDPNGEADLVNGGYLNHDRGASIEYSRRNWLRRWEIDGRGTGWFLEVNG